MAKGILAAAMLGLAALCAGTSSSAQTRLFSESTEIPIVIEGPIGELVRRAVRNTDPVAAALTVEDRRYDMELEPRGFSRRTLGICQFPPLRLNLAGERQGGIMQGQNKLKLVTRCRPGTSYEQFLVLEYTAYRLYNEITPLSYRVRPVQTTYRDTAGRRREETQWNFLIEDSSDMARRNNRVEIQVRSREVPSTALDPQQAAIVGMFQYMIGNLDWDMVEGSDPEDCCHNGKLFAASATSRERVVPVPYDFDYSGFVNASYATPPAGFATRDVRQRVYRGYCRYNEQAQAAAELFRSRRAQIYAVIDGETRLTAARRNSARGYIDDFYQVLDDPQRFQRRIIDECRR